MENEKNILTIKNVFKKYDDKEVLKDISFDVKKGITLCIVGESGSGKSTLLKCINALVPFDGSIKFNDLEINNMKSKDLVDLRANISLIFQNPKSALNPHKKVQWILEEGLKIRGVKKEVRVSKINEMIKLFSFDEKLLSRYPKELSGGEAQRVMLMSTLLLEPKLLLLDEPVSALDQMLASQTLNLLKDIQNKFDLTMIFVTHDLKVCKYISDYTIVFKDGVIVEENTTENLFNEQKHPYTIELMKSVL